MLEEAGIIIGRLVSSRNSSTLTPEEFEARQLRKFRRLVHHANAHSEYYAHTIRQRGISLDTCTPADFPLMTKSILMGNFDRIVTDKRITKKGISDFLERSKDPSEKFLGRWRVMDTSGTSGEVGYFLYSNADWLRGLLGGAMRRRRRLPRRPAHKGKFRFAFYGATGGHFAGVTMTTAFNGGIASLFAESRAFEVNSPLPGTVEQLNAYQPDLLSGYTAALRMLAEKQNAGLLKIAPLAIAATGETVTQGDMEFLSKAFGCEVTSAYGCTEHLAVGASDPGGETMTLNDENLIFEFHDDHSVITNLFNYTMPLIRYRMSDILIPVPLKPGEPRRLAIKNLVGRTERMPTFLNRDGVSDFISPHTINEIIVPGVTRFQMHLTGPSAFKLLVVLDPALDAAGKAKAISGAEKRLQEILDQKGMPNVTFEVAAVDDLPVDPRTRKFKLIVDDREAAKA